MNDILLYSASSNDDDDDDDEDNEYYVNDFKIRQRINIPKKSGTKGLGSYYVLTKVER
jgi:hypothetical protein